MKEKKGRPNYLYELKRYDLINCVFEWLIVILVVALGYVFTGKIFNVISIIATAAVYFPVKNTKEHLKKHPFHPMDDEKRSSLIEINEFIHILYNPLIEFRGKVMGIEAIAVSGTTVLVYISNPKTSAKFSEKFLSTVLSRRVDKINIKFFYEFKSFYDRAEGLHNMAKISNTEVTTEEKKIISTIFRYYI